MYRFLSASKNHLHLMYICGCNAPTAANPKESLALKSPMLRIYLNKSLPGLESTSPILHSLRICYSLIQSQLMVLLIYLITQAEIEEQFEALPLSLSLKSNHLVLVILPLHFLEETLLTTTLSFRPAAPLTLNARKACQVLANFKHCSSLHLASEYSKPEVPMVV